MFNQHFHNVGAVRLHVSVGPDSGPPIVLLHGVLRDERDFAPLWPALLPRWQIHGVDLRGHGLSARGAGRYLVQDYVGDVVEVLRRLAPGAVLFGHSLGALVAAAAASALTERVRAVILEDPPGPSFLAHVDQSAWHAVWRGMQRLAGETGQTTSQRARALAELRVPARDGRETRLGDLRDPAALRFSARCLAKVDPAVLTPLLESRWLQELDLLGLLAGVRCPALILRGEEGLGGMLTRAEANDMAARMHDAAVVDVVGAGHLLHWQALEATTRLCLSFLESL